jgi:DHA1 family multidrug resistance protein-like MFS transporter
LNRNLLFVALALLTWGFGEGMFFNFQPIYLKSLGSNEQQIGLILGAFGAVMAITHIPAGRLSDRIGRRPLLFSAWIMGLVATVIMAFARELPLFIVGMLAYGLTAFVSSPLSSYVTAARGKWSVGTALSLTTATFSGGMVFGPLAGGWIGEHYGLRSVYTVAVFVFLVSNFFIFFIQKQPIDHHDPESPPMGLMKNTRFVSYLGIVMFAIFAMYLAQPLTPNFLEDVRGLSLSNIGVIFMFGALGNALSAIFLSRTNPYRGFILSQLMVVVFVFIMLRGAGLAVFALGYFLLGGFRAGRPLAMAQARELVHESQMGLTYGVMETVSAVVFILTPPLAGYMYKIDPMTIYTFSLGLIAVSVLISIILPRRLVHA